MSEVVRANDKVSHLLHHMAHYSSHEICHCFVKAKYCFHGTQKEVSTADGTLLVKIVTLGKLRMLQILAF